MLKPKPNCVALEGVHTCTRASGYLEYKKIIFKNIKTHVLYIIFGIPNFICKLHVSYCC